MSSGEVGRSGEREGGREGAASACVRKGERSKRGWGLQGLRVGADNPHCCACTFLGLCSLSTPRTAPHHRNKIAAASPLEVRWTSGSSSSLSPAAGTPHSLHCWVGVIMYLPPEPEKRAAVTDA